MNQNPYQPPRTSGDDRFSNGPDGSTRRALLLAAVGGWLAAAYWAAMTLLLGVGVATRHVSGMQVILPLFLIGLYIQRGYRVYQGDAMAAQRLMWLHGIGGAVAVLQMASAGAVLIVFYVVKVLVHVFGGFTAFRAHRALLAGR